MSASWKKLEDHVCALASLRWLQPCRPEHIDGVDFDGVVRVTPDEIVLIEITTEMSLNKVRDDLNKISPVRINFALQGIISRGYIVMVDSPTNSMVEAGRAAHITVCSAQDFEREFFDFRAYDALRRELPFGSAIDSKTGRNDQREFISVRYEESEGSHQYSLEQLAEKVIRGGKVVLTGDFGAGKSRCVRELYMSISQRTREAGGFPLAINLRDHWSSSNALEVLAGHLGNVGLSSSIDNVVRLLNAGNLVLLLDGFDEIGAQSHDTRIEDRQSLRRRAVQGVRDLITKSKAGVLVTGRSHFFDSDDEMLQSLGLSGKDKSTIALSVPENFTVEEGKEYLSTLGVTADVPNWLPRKPLVFQVLAELDPLAVTRMLSQEHGEYQFWRTFVDAACVRESKGVGESISQHTIMRILLELASKTRDSESFLGRLSPRDIDVAYEQAVGSAPDQTGRQLLSRMCTLGRIEPESPDRQFVDYNIVDILRAERLTLEVTAMAPYHLDKQWRQSLLTLGSVYAATMVKSFDLEPLFMSYLKKFGNVRNTRKLGEIISILTIWGPEEIDFQSLQIIGGNFPVLDLRGRKIRSLVIKDSEIQMLLVEDTKAVGSESFSIQGSIIYRVSGISSKAGTPNWITDTDIVKYDEVSNSARIKESEIDPKHKLFLAIIHKIFFQPGAGREETALLKGGYGQKYDPKLAEDIIRLLLREKVIERFKGKDGWVYTPVRKNTQRMDHIRSELTLSDDPLWTAVGDL